MCANISLNSQICGRALLGAWVLKGMNTVLLFDGSLCHIDWILLSNKMNERANIFILIFDCLKHVKHSLARTYHEVGMH